MATQPVTVRHAPRKRSSRGTVIAAVLLGLPYVAGILLLTLSPQPVQRRMPVLLDLVVRFVHDELGWSWLGFNRLEFLANVLVFVPIGILAFMLFRERLILLAFAAGPVLSVGVEIAQEMLLPHRVSTVVDVFANSVGATAGVLLAWGISRLARRTSNAP